MTQPGNLRYLVAFESPVSQSNPGGKIRATVWHKEFEIWASVTYMAGTEPVIAQRLIGIQPVKLSVRRSQSTERIQSSWRGITRDGKVFNLKSVTPDNKRQYIDIICQEGAGGGG